MLKKVHEFVSSLAGLKALRKSRKNISGFDARITYDPAPHWKTFGKPVLYLAGEYDVLEPVRDSAAKLKEILSQSRNPDFTIKIFPKTNHPMLLTDSNKPSDFQMMKGVGQFVPGYCDTLLRWLTQHTQP